MALPAQPRKCQSPGLSPENDTYPRIIQRLMHRSDVDRLDPAAGETKDPVLRHFEAERLMARQTGIEPAHDPGDDAVADGDDRDLAQFAEPRCDPSAKHLIALAVRGHEIPLELLKPRA